MTKITFRIILTLRNIKRRYWTGLKHKVNQAISNKEPLLCIGFLLPEFNLSDLTISIEFTKPVYFPDSQFFGKANFFKANLQGEANFEEANF
jgi:hypothetical protein